MKQLSKDNLLKLSSTLAGLADDKETAKTILNAAERLKNLEFNLVLLGQFNRGKSTLANCFLGKNIIPVGVVPLTSIVTEIRFGDKDEIHVYFVNKKRPNIFSISKLADFVTEKHNPKNRKNVERAVVYCKSDFLKNNLVLIDTPGISSTLLHNTKVTQDYIPNCDAAVLIISADSPLSNEEMEFIKSIHKYSTKIFFILNKSDYASGKEIKEMTSHVKTELSNLGVNTKIIPVSAKLGLEGKLNKNRALLKSGGVLQLEKNLLGFLSKNKNTTLIESAKLKINSISKSLYNQLQSEHAAASMTVQAISKKSEEFNNQFSLIKNSALLYSGSLDSEFEELMTEISKDMKNEKDNIVKSVHSKIIATFGKKHEGKLLDHVNSLLDRYVKEELTKWWKVEDKKITAKLAEVEKRYMYLINDTNRRLKEASSHIFRFTPKQASSKYSMNFRTLFYFNIEGFGQDSFMLPSISILPSSMQRKKVLDKLEEKVMHNVDMNLGRIRYDYQQRLEKGKENFKDELLKSLENTKKEIESGLRKGRNIAKLTIEEKTEAREALSKKLAVLSEIIKATG